MNVTLFFSRVFSICVLLCVLLISNQCQSFEQQSLNGEWKLSDINKKYNGLNAQVPGGIYTDLMQNDVIGDVFYGFNDVETRWVAKEQWNYTHIFNVKPEMLGHNHVNLILEGVDTFSTIFFNGKQIGNTDNMFVRYEFDVTRLLMTDTNCLSVIFESPIKKSQSLFNEQAKNYTVPPKCVPPKYNGECHVNHIRKMQASFAWDWGPAFPSVGLWKNVYLNAYNETYIKDITIAINETDDDNYHFKVIVFAAANNRNELNGIMSVSIANKREIDVINFDLDEKSTQGRNEFVICKEFTMPTDKFQLWWPNGYGDQNLYSLNVSLLNNGEQVSKCVKIGIRNVQIVQQPFGNGRSFYFNVNGIPIFAKGSNMVPSHILPEHSNNETLIRRLMQNAKDVHMNMLRVWGGGLYESDKLYEIADEMGIMIWQDFMFACSMYPTSDRFLSTVRKEVEHQVRRLQHHPSIVLWAGNNENEVALRSNWYGTFLKQSLYEEDYRQLYGETIREEVLKNDPTRVYLGSSPTNGMKSEAEGYIAKNPQDNAYGDIHYYNYLWDSWDINIYPVPRFASEYGYQALPSYKSMMTATNNESDLFVDSEFMAHRQHHPLGYIEMEHLIKMRLQLPEKTNSVSYNKAFYYYSQIVQAMGIKVETEHYRQMRSYVNDEGYGLTMGALYWQFNCPWKAPTWSSVDSSGNWKMLHYYAKDFFSPVIVTSHLHRNQSVDIYIVSDLWTPIFNATLTRTVFRWDSFVPVNEETSLVNIRTGSTRITRINLPIFLGRNHKCTEDNCFLRYTLTKSNGKTDTIAPEHYIFPKPLHNVPVQSANVQIESVEGISSKKYRINIKTNKPALFVWLESMLEGKFSENGFMQVQARREIVFEAEEGWTVGEVLSSLEITHLKDEMYFPKHKFVI